MRRRSYWSEILTIACWMTMAPILCLAPAAAPAVELEIVVPAYFYPSADSAWSQLNTAATQVPITAIMNPSSGPGNSQDNNYVRAVGDFRSASGRVIGYVSSSYTNRPLENVLADIDRYAEWYDIDGIFVDEMTNTESAAALDFYQTVYNHVKTTEPAWEVMGNPGINTTESYLTRPTADRLMVFESFGVAYPGHVPSFWNKEYDRGRFVNLLHTLDSATAMEQYIDLAVTRNVGGVYFTDDVLNNPWNQLPAYWEEQVAKVAAINKLVLGPLDSQSNFVAGGSLAIDPSRLDWQAIPAYADDVDETTTGPEVDFRRIHVANDAESLFFRLLISDAAGAAQELGPAHNIYLDTDGNRFTGFIGEDGLLALGADYLIRGDRLFEFQGSTQQVFSWGFEHVLKANDSPASDIELAVELVELGNPEALDFIVHADNSIVQDFLPNSASSGPLGGFFRYQVATRVVMQGDYNGDGEIDEKDYDAWQGSFAAIHTPADGNGDGVVNAADYTVWRDAWSDSAEARVKVVPEPSTRLAATLTLLLVAGNSRSGCLLIRRHAH